MDSERVKQEANRLIDLALLLDPEGEPLDLSDIGFEPQDMAELRSVLSSMRSSIDAVNNALARAWDEEHKGQSYTDSTNRWWVGRTKKKRFIKESNFYEWLATKDEWELEALINPTNIKVGGLTEAERSTFYDESEWTDTLSIKSMPKDLDA
jgi:hypothetical protein